MSSTKGYIYIRNHPSYDGYDACKIGKTNNILERDTQYATGEIKRGYFLEVFEVHIEKMGLIERLLQTEFSELNVRYDAGTEFYNKKCIARIEPFFIKKAIHYKKLSKDEISCLVRCNRTIEDMKKKENMKKIKIKPVKPIQTLDIPNNTDIVPFKPRIYQSEIISKSVKHFQKNNKGLLVLPCGLGKTLISLWVAQDFKSNTILIGVPNILLLDHWNNYASILFKNIPFLIVKGGVHEENITKFLKENKKECIVLTTYTSAHKLYACSQKTRFVFDMKILDEVHHLTSSNMRLAHTTKKYIQMLNIKSVKQLGLTATPKHLESQFDCDIVISNDNMEYFGEIIDKKCLLWAINENIICDYVVQTIVTDEEQLEEQMLKFSIIEENDKRLFLSAFASLKSIYDGNSHHLLIYSNNKVNSLKIIQYIKLLLENKYFDIPELYYSNYHSEINPSIQKNILESFEKTKYGIITCVYCLGEGWDFPLLDGVIFSENMTSNIRILQSALRPCRKDKNNKEKIAKIILPILNKDDWLEDDDNSDLKKVREVVYQMGLEDETITQKIRVSRINIEKNISPKNKYDKKITVYQEFGEYEETLTQKIRLKTTKRTALTITYEKARKIITDKNIKSKDSYFKLCEKDNRLSEDPETVYKGKFTSWIEYLSIERIYYDIETCKIKVSDLLLKYPEIKDRLNLDMVISKLCKLDPLFPPKGLWVEYYNVKDLRDVIIMNNNKKKRGILL
jgi:superfamily II DNA or RNA helicase